jgi:hypothetical protein
LAACAAAVPEETAWFAPIAAVDTLGLAGLTAC